jgi:hypothetical protein
LPSSSIAARNFCWSLALNLSISFIEGVSPCSAISEELQNEKPWAWLKC